MLLVREIHGQETRKNTSCLLKGDTMLLQIVFRFLIVPFELQTKPWFLSLEHKEPAPVSTQALRF